MADEKKTMSNGDAFVIKVKSDIDTKDYFSSSAFRNQTETDPVQEQLIEFAHALISLNPGFFGSSLAFSENQINQTLNEHVGQTIEIPNGLILGNKTVSGKSTEQTTTTTEDHTLDKSKDPDGVETVIETKQDGSQIITQKNADGSEIVSERKQETNNQNDFNDPAINDNRRDIIPSQSESEGKKMLLEMTKEEAYNAGYKKAIQDGRSEKEALQNAEKLAETNEHLKRAKNNGADVTVTENTENKYTIKVKGKTGSYNKNPESTSQTVPEFRENASLSTDSKKEKTKNFF